MVKNGRGGRRNQRLNRASQSTTTISTPQTTTLPPEEPNNSTGTTLPEDVIVEILCRTPVESLLCFRFVCKPWNALICHPKFIEMHLKRTSLDPKNHYMIFHTFAHNFSRRSISLFRLNEPPITLFGINPMSTPKLTTPFTPSKINFSSFFNEMVLVGSINGIVCLSQRNEPRGRIVVLWNPATKHWKPISLPEPKSKFDMWHIVSVGLGFDSVAIDFKIIRVVPVVTPIRQSFTRSRVEMYSAERDSWKDVEGMIPFWPKGDGNCNVIFKGNPYFVGITKEDDEGHDVLGAFDPRDGSYREILYPEIVKNGSTAVTPVNLMDSVAAMVYSPGEKPNQMVDVYELNESSGSWVKKYTTGPILLDVLRLPQCFKDTGEIVVEDGTALRNTFFYDPKTNCVLGTTGIEAFKPLWYESYSHVESLVCIKGMRPLGKEDKNKNKAKPTRKNRDGFLSEGFELVLRLN